MGIDSEIARVQGKIAEYERASELLRAELRGLMTAKRFMEDTPPRPVSPAPSKRGGRQPGAISNRWKEVLGVLYAMDGSFDEGTVAEVVFDLESRRIKPADIRRIFDGYVEHGYVAHADAGMFRVTDEAASKFGFERPPRADKADTDFDFE